MAQSQQKVEKRHSNICSADFTVEHMLPCVCPRFPAFRMELKQDSVEEVRISL
jgi:hypothetical protein